MPEVNIIVKAKDEASKTLQGIGGNLGKLGTGFAVVGAAGVAALAGIGIAAGKLAYDAAMVEPVKITFDNLTQSIGSTADAMLEKLRPATMGVLSDLDLMRASNKLMAMGLADSEDSAAKLANMAVTLGTAMGVEAGPAIENFTLMLANQSIPRLDTYGISAGKVRERINELMEATEGMTREEAFMIAVMEQGEVAMAKVGDISETSAVKIAAFRATMGNLKDTIGTALLPVFSTLVDKVLTPLAGKLTEIMPTVTMLIEVFAGLGTEILSGDFNRAIGFLQNEVWEVLDHVFGAETADKIVAFGTQVLEVIQNQVMPTLRNLASFLVDIAQVVFPILQRAIQFVVDHWKIFAAIGAAVGLVILALEAPIVLIVGAIALLATAWANNWGGIQDKVRAVWDFLSPIFALIGEALNFLATVILPFIQSAFEAAWSFIRDLIKAVWEAIKPHLLELQDVLRKFWTEMQPRLQEAWAAIRVAMQVVQEWVKTTLIPALQDLWDRLEPVREIIIKVAAAFASFMASAFVTALKGWLSMIIGLWDGMASAIGTVIDAIREVLNWIQRAIDAWRRFTASGAGGGSPGGGLAPGLQSGLAYVPATMPAIIHRGEAVLTSEQAAKWRMGQGGPDIHIHMGGDMFGIDGVREAVEKVLEEKARYTR